MSNWPLMDYLRAGQRTHIALIIQSIPLLGRGEVYRFRGEGFQKLETPYITDLVEFETSRIVAGNHDLLWTPVDDPCDRSTWNEMYWLATIHAAAYLIRLPVSELSSTRVEMTREMVPILVPKLTQLGNCVDSDRKEACIQIP